MDHTEALKIMFNNHTYYSIPIYQRGYSWEKKQIKEFLDDLEYANDNEHNIHAHFFGSILLADHGESTNKPVKIIDGQQRMTTSLLFFICARNFFYAHKDNSPRAAEYYERLEQIIYVPPINPDPNLNKPRLTLSKANKDFFHTLLRQRSVVDPLSLIDRSNDSSVLLATAYERINTWITQKSGIETNDPQNELDIDAMAQIVYSYVNTLLAKFTVSQYHCKDESEAYRIFNLVNNRGTTLDPSDLIKSFLFGKLATSAISDEELDAYDVSWNEMRVNITNKHSSDYDLDRFLYHYLLTFYSSKLADDSTDHYKPVPIHLKQKHMYDPFVTLVNKHSIHPSEIIKGLYDWSHRLNQIRNPTVVNFHKNDNTIHYLKKIKSTNEVFVYPAILAGYNKYYRGKTKFYKSFEALVMLCFKYHVRIKVIGTSTSLPNYEDTMYGIMNSINSDVPIKDIINNLVNDHEKYPKNDQVKANLMAYRVKKPPLAIALLEEIESLGASTRSQYDVSLEHIMPKKFAPWEQYIIDNNPNVDSNQAKDIHRQYLTLLGNLTLLPSKINTSISNKPFEVKKVEYAKHKTLKMTEALSHIPIWNIQSITTRQEKLADDLIRAIDLKRIITDLRL